MSAAGCLNLNGKSLALFFCIFNALSFDSAFGNFDVWTANSNRFEPVVDASSILPSNFTIKLTTFVNVVDERYVSVALDSSLIADHWPCFDFRSSRLSTLAKELSPAYLRMGGSAADFLIFQKHFNPVVFNHHKCDAGYDRRNFSTFYMTSIDFDNIYHFAWNAGMRLVFDLNVLVRNSKNQWNSTNAEILLEYAIQKNYSQNLDLELGNEPNAFTHAYHRNVSAQLLADDYRYLRKLLKAWPEYQLSLLIGPSITQPKKSSLDYLKQFLEAVQYSVDAITVHHYYIDGRVATLDDMMSAKLLDSLSDSLDKLQQTIRMAAYSNVPVWLGETSSCWGGGALGLSDSYAAGFMWLDKLGLAALRGVHVVIRQSFFHGHYALVDDSINPNTYWLNNTGSRAAMVVTDTEIVGKLDFWLTWLYKRLVGRHVLAVDATDAKHVRSYAHCTNYKRSEYPKGSVTMYILNLNHRNRTYTFPQELLKLEKHVYWLLPHGPGGLRSKFVSLSGKVLRLINNTTLPKPVPTVIKGGQTVLLPAATYGFIVIPNANAPGCQDE